MKKVALLHTALPVIFVLASHLLSAQQRYYVNDNYAPGIDVYTTAAGNNSNLGTALSPFATISYAISIAQAGDTILVDAGTYAENVIVDKSITLKGAKAGLDPGASLDRSNETVVRPSGNDIQNGVVFAVRSINVTIDGFLIDGDNPAVSGGATINGVDVNAGMGVFNQQNFVDGLTVKNNIIKNFNRYGVFLRRLNQPTVTENNQVSNNHFDNANNSGVGMLTNAYATVINNYFTRVVNGVFFGSGTIASSLQITIANNYIEASATNIVFASMSATAPYIAIINNTLNPVGAPGNGTAISMGTVTTNGTVQLSNNVISNKFNGIEVSTVTAPGGVLINGGAVINSSGVGLFLIAENTTFSISDLFLNNNNVGFDASGVGSSFRLSFSNVAINGGTTGIRFYGNGLSLPGNALTGVRFSGQTKEYILQTANSFNGQVIDASTAVFDGIAPVNMTLAQLFATEDKLTHKMDFNDVGYFKLKPNKVYVTPNSFAATLPPVFGTPTAAPDINRAVGCANAGDTIYIAAGTYANQVTIDKGLTLIGEGQNSTFIVPPSLPYVAPPGPFPEKGLIQTIQNIGDVHISELSATGDPSNSLQGIIIQSGGSVRNCKVHGSQGIYFRVESEVKTAEITNNIISGYISVNVQGSNLTAAVINNTLTGIDPNFSAGIFAGLDFGPLPQFTATGNAISNYTYSGFFGGSVNTTITENSMLGTGPAIWQLTGNTINATCNWFGTSDAEQIKLKLTGSINYGPWLVNGTDTDPVALGFQSVPESCTGRQNKFYVNDNSQTGDVFTSAVGNNNNNGFSSAPFATFEYAYSIAQAGDTIYMDAGNYPMADFILDKAITVLGPNYLVSPNDPNNKRLLNTGRNAESTISGAWFTIASSNISIRGLVFSPGSKSAFSLLNSAGTNNDFRNFRFEKNILKTNAPGSTQLSFTGVFVTSPGMPQTSGYIITDNRFEKNDAGSGTTVHFGYLKNIIVTDNSFVVTGSTPRTQNTLLLGFPGIADSVVFSNNTVDRANIVVNGPRVANAVIANNKFYNTGTSCNFNNSITTSSNIEIAGNYMETTSGGAPFILYNRTGGAFAGSSTIFKAENNIMNGTSSGVTGQLFASFAVTVNNSVLNPIIILKGNKIDYSGDFSMIENGFVRPITLRGKIANATVETNEINFNNTAGVLLPGTAGLPPNPGITINTEFGTGAFIPSNALFNIINNKIEGFKQSVVFYDGFTGAGALNSYLGYGNLPGGAVVNINKNSFTNDSISINNGAVGQSVNANCNWYDSVSAQAVANKVSNGSVIYSPWLTNGTDSDVATGFQPTPGSCDGTPVAVTLNTKTDISCFGANNGSISINVSDGKAPYTIEWTKDGETYSSIEDLTNLSPGTYCVTITDGNGSVASITDIVVSEPLLLAASASGANVSCYGGSNGSALVTAEGGTAPYTYLWSNGATTDDISGLSAGNYTVTITDANGCTANANYVVTQPSLLTAVATGTSTACFNSISVAANGGTTPYTYLWSNGATASTISSIAAGTYSVVVTDANGCTANASATVTANEAFNPSASVSDVSCYGGANGSITVTNVNAVAPFQYSIDGGLSYQSSAVFNGLAAGTYTITVKDANGCTGFVTKTITQPTQLVATVNTIQSSCFAANTGSINVSVTGGSPAYIYYWVGPNNYSSTQLNIGNLAAGNYLLAITDSKGCTVTKSVLVPSFNEIIVNSTVTNVLCKGENNGAINLTVSGGTGSGFTYLWNTGAVTSSISNLGVGNYSVVITDAASGCAISRAFTITQPAWMLNLATSKTNATGCDYLGKIEAVGSGGTPGYQYKLNNGSYQTTSLFAGLYAGNYTIWVKDANGCTKSTVVSITDNGSDEYENNNTKNQARQIPVGTDVVARIALANDIDWFKFTKNSGNPVYRFSINHPSANFNFEVYPEGNNAPALVPVATGPNYKDYVTQVNNTYYIRVTGGLSYVCYQLTVASPPLSAARLSESDKNEITPQELSASVFPNPHQGNFMMKIESPVSGKATIELFNASVQKIIEKAIVLQKGSNNFVPFKGISQGAIFYRVRTSKYAVNGKIIGAN